MMQPLKEKTLSNGKKIQLLQYTQKFFCVDSVSNEIAYTMACFEKLEDATTFFNAIIR